MALGCQGVESSAPRPPADRAPYPDGDVGSEPGSSAASVAASSADGDDDHSDSDVSVGGVHDVFCAVRRRGHVTPTSNLCASCH